MLRRCYFAISGALSYAVAPITYVTGLWRPHYNITTAPDSRDVARNASDHYEAGRHGLLNDRYELLQKLGTGIYSSVYLSRDKSMSGAVPTYVVVKVLTRDATAECLGDEKTMLELEIMQKIRAAGGHELLPYLLDDFTIPDETSGKPAHLCMVMNVLGSDLASFRRTSQTKALPSHTVRVILRQVVRALTHVHRLGIVHTDIKPDNILFHTKMSAEDIERWLEVPRKFEESHALPNPPTWTSDCGVEIARQMEVSLVDYGQAQFVDGPPTVSEFSAFSLRAPEVILRAEFTTAIDIWTIGCIAFEMLVGRWLYHPVEGLPDWTLEDDHLAKMLEFTGEKFPEKMWKHPPEAAAYFDDQGKLLRISELFPVTIEDALRNYNLLTEAEIRAAADFIRACVRLDPCDRLTAEGLLQHPWLSEAVF